MSTGSATPSDSSWSSFCAVLAPRLEKVLELRAEVSAASEAMSSLNGRRFRMATFERSASEVRQRLAELQQINIGQAASTAAVRTALTLARDARRQAQGELALAQQELISLLSVKQEATLYQFGIID